MGYIEDSLAAGEKVLYRTRLHWIVLLGPLTAAVACAAVAAALFVVAATRAGEPGSWIVAALGGVCALAALLAFAAGAVRRSSTEMAVTNRRVLMKSGIVSRRTTELMLSKVESIGVNQGILGRLAGYGSIVVRGTGGTFEHFDRVARPLEFRRRVQEQIDTHAGAGPVAAPPAAS